jgi:hypothetical protein
MNGVMAAPEVSPFDRARKGLGQPLPGRVAVLYPLSVESDELIQVPGWIKRKEEHLMGAPLEIRKVKVLSSGFPGIWAGDTVGVRCDAACLALDYRDYEWIAEGFEVRIYGVYEPIVSGQSSGEDVVFFKVAA